MTELIAPYILTTEYECAHCHRLPPEFEIQDGVPTMYYELFDAFSLIRNEFGKSINITSGYRCPEHNKQIGGNSLSVHQWGLALDLNCINIAEVDDLATIVDSVAPHLRMGKYKDAGTFIHIDTGFFIMPAGSLNWKQGVRWYG